MSYRKFVARALQSLDAPIRAKVASQLASEISKQAKNEVIMAYARKDIPSEVIDEAIEASKKSRKTVDIWAYNGIDREIKELLLEECDDEDRGEYEGTDIRGRFWSVRVFAK